MDAIMTETFATLSFVLSTWLVFMGCSGVATLIILTIPHRETAHDLVDYIYDNGNALLNWIGNTTHKVVEETKAIAVLAIMPFVWIGQGLWDLTKIIGKGLAISAVVLTIVMVTAVILAGGALSFWAALPFILAYVAGLKTLSAAKAAKAKVSEIIAARKAATIAAAEKAEVERLEAVKAEAKALGFVSGDEVEAMIAKAIKAHEAERHEYLDLKVEAVTIGLSRAVARQAEIVAVADNRSRWCFDLGVQLLDSQLVEHAVTIARKSIEDFNLQTKAGRKAARTYLRDNGVEIAGNANRYEIGKKFELLN